MRGSGELGKGSVMVRLLFVLLLSGCATQATIPIPVDCPRPEVPANPRLPVQDLTSESGYEETVRAYVASLEVCTLHVKSLRELLD